MSAQSDAVLRIAVDRDNERTHRERAERALRRAQDRLAAVERLCKSFDPTSGSGRARAFVGDIRAALGAAVTPTPQDDDERCRRCGSPNPPWAAASPLWNTVMRDPETRYEENGWGIICPNCFIALADGAGKAECFRLTAERHVDFPASPDGHVWDDAEFRWVTPEAATERCHEHHKIAPDERGRTCCCTQPSCPVTELQRATTEER